MKTATVTTKNIWKIALPIMIGGVAQNIVNVTDTAFLSHLGNIELGAAGNMGILYFIFVITGMGFTTGAQIIIGRRNGEKNYEKIGALVDHSFYFMIPFGILLTCVLYFIIPNLLTTMIHSEDVCAASSSFLRVRSFGIVFAFSNFILNSFYVGTTRTRMITYGTILMSLVNVLLDYGLIFGNLGLPKMGIEGAALASVIAELTSCLFLLFATFYWVDLKKYNLFKFVRFDWSMLKRIFNIGLPIMFQSFVTLLSWYVFFMIIEWMGEQPLAVSHIVRSIYMVMMIPMFGLSMAANTITSNLIGMGQENQVLSTAWKIVGLAALCSIPASIVNFIIPETIAGLYTTDLSLIPDIVSTLYVINISMFFFCAAYILFSSVTGTGNTKVSLLIELINICIYLSAAFFLVRVFHPPIATVWCSEFVYFSFLALMSWYYLKYGNWRSKEV